MPVPFHGEEFEFTQPDGTTLKVRGWGDQHFARFETLDGFTVTEDPVTGFYTYATLSADKENLESTSVRPGLIDPGNLGLTPSLRIIGESAKAKAAIQFPLKTRWQERRENRRLELRAMSMARGILPAPPHRETVGKYVGLCLLVQFPDVPGKIAQLEVDNFCNKKGYSGFGNNGSVYDYFYDNSNGKLEYKIIVAPYYTAKHSRSYYTDERIPQPVRAYELIKEALRHLSKQGFDPGSLSADEGGYVYALNVFYAGKRENRWAKGLWPHSYRLDVPYRLNDNKIIADYQITDIGEELSLATFCHENGHMLCDYPDLYDYGHESQGVGVFCLMCGGGVYSPKNPAQIGAYLKYKAGWADSIIDLKQEKSVSISSDKNDFCVYRKDFKEYFLFENRLSASRDSLLPCSGLAVWHVDESGSNDNEQMTLSQHYECSLEQADGNCDFEKNRNPGNATDLFPTTINDKFGASTEPSSKWWDGTPSGLEIHNISKPGKQITFQVG